MVYGEEEGEIFLGRPITKTTNMSEETMRKVDSEIRRIIDEQYTAARTLLETHRNEVEAMARALLEWETIDAEQIDDIVNGRPPRPPAQGSSSAPSGGGAGGAGQTGGTPAAAPASAAEPAA